MNQGKIPVRYARALFSSAMDKDIVEEVYADMLLVQEVSRLVDFQETLSNKVIKPSKKITIIEELFSGKVNPLSMALLKMVVANGRGEFINGVARMFIEETRRHKGITPVTITTAAPLEASLAEKISKSVEKNFTTKVELTGEVKEDLIGGFVLRIGDKLLDMSIKKRLAIIRKELTSN